MSPGRYGGAVPVSIELGRSSATDPDTTGTGLKIDTLRHLSAGQRRQAREAAMERHSRKILVGTSAILAFSLAAMNAVDVAQAFPTDSWTVEAGEHLAVLRDFACWDDDGFGKRETFKTVTFSRNVLSAEIFLSGYNMSHTMDNASL